MKPMRWLAALAVLAASLAAPAAETMYAASVRGTPGEGAQQLAGNLYRVDVSSGVFSLVGAIRVDGTQPVGVTGLADHPVTGVLYGITSTLSPNHPRSLVTVDIATARAKLIGSLGAAGSDIAFDGTGNLYVWLRETSQLGIVDLATGAATPIGPSGAPGQPAGVAIDAAGRAYLAASGASGTIDRIDTTTGAIAKGPALRDAPYPNGINSLAVSPEGAIFAVNTNHGVPANTLLVRIDPATGAVKQLGPLPNDTDALVFVEAPWTAKEFLAAYGLWALGALVVFGIALAYFLGRRSRRPAG